MTRPERRLRLGTRGSPLALWQARWVAERIQAAAPSCEVDLEVVRTTAEQFPDKALTELGVGIFTAELDRALLERRIDAAVHSLKDVPSAHHPDLALAAVPERESPWDAFLSPRGTRFDALETGARIGTSSPRRRAQILWRRGDLVVVPLRGNVETRLRKVEEEKLAGTVLAHAGLRRLERESLITEILRADVLIPAVAQGALAVMTRAGDAATRGIVAALDHRGSRLRVEAERAFLRRLEGGCQVPAGALAEWEKDGNLRLVGVLLSLDGSRRIAAERRGPAERAEELGRDLAETILGDGGSEILKELRRVDS